jgi:Xaa-Pro aminopeptidase
MVGDIIDLEERDRRWRNIRRELEKNDLDALIVVSDGQLERRGSFRYVSNADAGAYTTLMWHYVLFPLEGEPKAINLNGGWITDSRRLPLRGGWVPESEPYAIALTDFVKELNIEKGNIGIEGDFVPMPVYQRLVNELPKATFKTGNSIHELKRVKSPEEIKLVEMGAEMMDKVYEACLEIARPGITWNDITSEVCRTLYQCGAEDIGGYPLSRSTKVIKPGDSYNLYPEAQASGGYWIQFGRLISFGEPKKELREAWDLNTQAQERGAEKLRPGQTGADVMKAINDSLKGSKYTGAPRSSGHAIGLDILEKPYISLDEETVFEPGMVVSIHPVFSPPVDAFEATADMFIVTEDEPVKISKITPEIAVIS